MKSNYISLKATILDMASSKAIRAVTAEDNLKEIGMDSITLIQFIVDIETMYGIEFEDDYLVLASNSNIIDIVDYVYGKVSEEV